MQHRTSSKSDPPPSRPTSPPEESRRPSLPYGTRDGWRPADDDDGPEAVAWRARTGLRRADRALAALGELNDNVAKLNATIEVWSKNADKHWSTLKKLAWGVGVPVLVAVVLGAGGMVWQWVSTLRH